FAKSAVADYKRIRPVVQQGDLYRLASPYERPLSAMMYVDETKSAAALFALGLDRDGEVSETLRPRGLDPDAKYEVREINRGTSLHAVLPAGAVFGRELMERGVAVKISGKYDSASFEIVRR
ncbi:MAG: GH36 C-terminal domain-containing protein, partial [Victivallales bacterium]|nr:GH36 C-terminal domain-containing protein [Victivallales bacterium]